MLSLARSFVVPLVLLGFPVRGDAQERRWTFETIKAGTLPEGWAAAKTGKGPGSVWQIVADESAPSGYQALAQTSTEGPNPLFNLCVVEAEQVKYRDVDLSVSFKAVSGKLDQGGGLVWRFRDADNYYVARLNPLEKNCRVYKVVEGERTQLGSADTEAAAGQWHRLRIVHDGNHVRCLLGNQLLLDVKDETFPDAGRIGLWTKADAVTFFDDLSATDSGVGAK